MTYRLKKSQSTKSGMGGGGGGGGVGWQHGLGLKARFNNDILLYG